MSSITINNKPINVASTLRKFFFTTETTAEVMDELKKLTPTDREDLIQGILKINGEIVYSK
jgi:hypothetical protein